MTCGIYLIENKKTGQQYIGQSNNIERRWREHLRCKDRKNSYIDNAIHKYGNEKFTLSIICELEKDDDLLNAMEEYYIWKYNTYKDKNHYNLTPGGDFNPAILPEVRAKMSKALSGENHPMYGKNGEESPFFGHKHTPKTKAKMSKANSGENNPMYGKKHTQESREKMSKAVSKARNTSGYYRVHKDKDSSCKQGFIWSYRYCEDGRQKRISSVDIKKLEKKVKAKDLEWIKFDE